MVKSQRQAVENALKNANNPLWVDSITVKDNKQSYDRFLSALSKYREVSREALAQKLAEQLAKRADEQNRIEIAENLKRQTGMDLQEFLAGSERVQERLQQLTTANVALIKSIPTQYLDKVELAVTQALANGELNSKLAKKIFAIGESTESRAKLIARDQASKFNAALTQARHEDLGITHYRWSTSGDERVRESHVDNDGKIFTYDDPPKETGNPGHDINCRCVAIPVLDKAEIERAEQIAEEKDANLAFYPVNYQYHIKELAEPLVKKEIEKYRLSIQEAVSIREYTANGFAKLNAELRADKASRQTKAFARLLNKALDKLPNFDGNVWRDVNLPEAILSSYVVGNTITEKAFTSSSHINNERYDSKAKHRLLIHSKKGKKIQNVSGLYSENEVLFKSNSKFKVIKRTQTREYLLIELQEI